MGKAFGKRWKYGVTAALVLALLCGGCTAETGAGAPDGAGMDGAGADAPGAYETDGAGADASGAYETETDVSDASGAYGSETGASDASGNATGTAGNASDGTLTVTFLDVGQGNAVLAEQNGCYMLVDGGDREYSSFVVSYLKEQGVEELDYVIASHYDADHLNGVVGALNAFPCGLILGPDDTADSRVYASFLDVIDEKDIELVYPAVGDTYTLGDAEFTIVCPDAYDAADGNDNSVGIRLVYGETSFLICGDAGTAVEKEMLAGGVVVDADVYLASHHGSEGSSSLEFMQAVSPETVVISVGSGNSYGHPAKTVLDNVQAVGAALYRTDLQGTLVAESDGNTISWNVQPCTDYRSGAEIAESDGAQADGNAGTGTDGNAGTESTYVMNRNTKKFHLPSCSSVEDISIENKANFTGSRDELIAAGYEPCKRCNP